jgi:hypothetical protein
MAAALWNFSGKMPTDLGFSRRRLLIGEGAMSEVDQGAHTTPRRGLGGAPWHGVASPWPRPALFRTLSRVGKIGGSGFVSSNSENISCVTFLKHKNSRKQGTGTLASR